MYLALRELELSSDCLQIVLIILVSVDCLIRWDNHKLISLQYPIPVFTE
jgi:hypothetical protein